MNNAKIAVIALMLAVGAYVVNAQNTHVVLRQPIPIMSVGPVESGSVDYKSLPKNARHYIDRLGSKVESCDKEFFTDNIKVVLENGLEIEFDKSGRVIEIDAPENSHLSGKMVRATVPDKIYQNLRILELDRKVSSISYDGTHYLVDFDDTYDEAIYSAKGNLLSIFKD